AGIAKEQAKNFQWGLRRSTLNHLMCIQFTDVAQVSNATRNYEILYERDDDDAERPDKRNSGNGRDQRNRGQQSNRPVNSGSSLCGRRHPGECRRAVGTYFKCSQNGHLQKDYKKNTTVSTSGQADKKPGASGRVFAITEDHATKTSAQVANAARNYEILHERDDDDAERLNKRQKSGDRHQLTTQQSSHRNHSHNNDRHGSDRRGGSDNHRSSNNNYSGNNNRNSGTRRDQINRGQQSNRPVNSGFQHSRGPSEGYSYPVCTTCGRRYLGECHRAAGTCFKCGQTGHLQKDCKKNTAASTSGQADKKPGASGRVFAITEDHATKTSGPAKSSGVNVSTLSRFIRKLEKSKESARSYSNHDLELVVSVVEETIHDAERIIQSVDHLHLHQTLNGRARPSERYSV
nr:hypothetical protein [Tanacetum cinerariifolium]